MLPVSLAASNDQYHSYDSCAGHRTVACLIFLVEAMDDDEQLHFFAVGRHPSSWLFENYFYWYLSQPLSYAAAGETTAFASGELFDSLVLFVPACVIVLTCMHHLVLIVDAGVNNRRISRCTAVVRSTKNHDHCFHNSVEQSYCSSTCCHGEHTRTARHPGQNHHRHVFLQ